MSRYSSRRAHRGENDRAADSLRGRPDDSLAAREIANSMGLQPMADLDLMIRNGWGDTPQTKLPSDWRTRRNPRRSVEE